MASNKFIIDLKNLEHEKSKNDVKNDRRKRSKHNSVSEITISEVELESIAEIETKSEKYHWNQHVCDHVKYTNYSTHLGNHHQTKYTLSKKRLKIPTNTVFDHKFHHKNHKSIKIQEQIIANNLNEKNVSNEKKKKNSTPAPFLKDVVSEKNNPNENHHKKRESCCCKIL